jgi:hypothetical protein
LPNYNVSIPREQNYLLIQEVSTRRANGEDVCPESIIREVVAKHYDKPLTPTDFQKKS